jgi:hypothetical protein
MSRSVVSLEVLGIGSSRYWGQSHGGLLGGPRCGDTASAVELLGLLDRDDPVGSRSMRQDRWHIYGEQLRLELTSPTQFTTLRI